VLVTFKSTAYADITMFGDAATDLLKLMGQSGNIPGAIMGKDVGAAMENLKKQLANYSESNTGSDTVSAQDDNLQDDHEGYVG